MPEEPGRPRPPSQVPADGVAPSEGAVAPGGGGRAVVRRAPQTLAKVSPVPLGSTKGGGWPPLVTQQQTGRRPLPGPHH